MFGNTGKILRCNLKDKSFKIEKFNQDLYKNYIGGSGLASRIIYDEIPADCDPLGPNNKILFMAGPLVGTMVPSCGRYTVCSKSPLGHWGEAHSGGTWGPRLKWSGYDGIIVEDVSEKPVYIEITNDSFDIKDASDYWGLKTSLTQKKIKEKIGKKRTNILTIGPSGEKLTNISAIVNDGERAAARTGLGAVMGSKKLKAIAIQSKGKIEIKNTDDFDRVIRKILQISSDSSNIFSSMSKGLTKYGTPYLMDMFAPTGDIPIKNWLGKGKEDWPGFLKIGGAKMYKTILVKNVGCYNCPIACGRHVKVESKIDPKYNFEGAGPEYETLAAFGSNTMLTDDLEVISICNNICNQYGIDTISTGSIIAWAVEAYEKGILTEKDLGFKLKTGNRSIIKLTELIAKKEGIGKLLSQGVEMASRELGGGDFAIHCKGLEVPMHDPRAFYGQSIAYATSPRGATHVDGGTMFVASGLLMPDIGITYRPGRFESYNAGFITSRTQDVMQVVNSSILCAFMSLALNTTIIAELLNAVTGWDYTVESLLESGERIWTVKRAFNINKCGLSNIEDIIPERLLKPVLKSHGKKPIMFKEMMEDYYQVRNWDSTGKPRTKLLDRLGLEKIKNDMNKI